jgi:hypothetical protein
MTSRELVYKTLEFENTSDRVPRQIWFLPWAEYNYPEEYRRIVRDFPADIVNCPVVYAKKTVTRGDPYEIGEFVDDWGCRFTNHQRGVFGQVKDPIVSPEDENWEDLGLVHFPEEWFSFDIEEVNRFCASTDQFVIAAACPRPFEQLQFIRGSPELYMDLAAPPEGLLRFIKKMHRFYCELLEKWAKTNVDALFMLDDWGSQQNLLVSPELWTALFKPLYRDYINIAHDHGKKMFMHSDGYTLALYPHLIEMGLDAFNSQIFCMGVEKLASFRGRITFWGEIDRQYLLPYGTADDIFKAVGEVYQSLWEQGGCIAQCEFGAGAKPENVRQVFESWNTVRSFR